MARWLIAGALCGLLFGGCGESRVERRQLVEPADEGAAETTAGHGMAARSPHDKMPAKATASPHGRMSAEAREKESPAVEVKDGKLDIDQIRLSVPKTWAQKPPRSDFVLAEFSLSRAEGDAVEGRLTISKAGGSISDNIERWRKQFGEKPEKQSQDTWEVSGIPVTLVDFSGTFQDQRGPFAPAAESPGYRMLAAIADVDGQLYFIKAYGPAKTMAARADEFRTFVRSMKLAGKR
jgi:hypothetical protein